MFSLHAALAVMDSYGMGENSSIAALRTMKDRGLIRKDGYVSQSDLDKIIREFAA
jgi:hypothetical protein